MPRFVCFLLSLLLIVSLPALAKDPPLPAQRPPNIVFILVDDLGWNHLSAANGTLGSARSFYPTPNIEKLAASGMSFTHSYTMPNCAPTRAAILSGQYPARTSNGVYTVHHLNRFPKAEKETTLLLGGENRKDIAAEGITLAEALKKNGYRTAHIGKYHVGGHDGPDTLPQNQGFDINIGGNEEGSQRGRCFAVKDDAGRWNFENLGDGAFDRYAQPYSKEYIETHGLDASLIGTPKHVTDAQADAAEDVIKSMAQQTAPFYLQLHTYAVHAKVIPRSDLVKDAKKRPMNLPEAVPGGTKISDTTLALRHEYSAFVVGLDQAVGRVLDALDDPNQDGDTADSILENTVVVFTSDNGGTHDHNAPLKGKKGNHTEGGIRVPLIVSWPDQIAANSTSSHLTHAVDFYPTFVDLSGGKWTPSDEEHPLDGSSFVGVLKGTRKADAPREPIYYLFPGYLTERSRPQASIIADHAGSRYKMTYLWESETWTLYDLHKDASEQKDLSASHPEITTALSKQLRDWIYRDAPKWKPQLPRYRASGETAHLKACEVTQ